MAKMLSRANKANAKVEEINKKVEEAKSDAEEKAITQAETDAVIKQQEEKEKSGANTQKLKRTTAFISGNFNLDDTYRVNNFDDKGKVVKETFENENFIIQVTVKDSYKHGLDAEY